MSGERRTLQNYAYWSSRKTHRSPAGPRPTLGDLQRSSSWWRLWCERCSHYAPMAFAAPVILWGADAPGDVLRECARCTACGSRGASLKHPTWGGTGISFMPFPTEASI
ncbi:MAG TPA: hypothetical protein VGJ20_36835 [Xanthobacteraceae bacterium]|jgi:hypothetical protein